MWRYLVGDLRFKGLKKKKRTIVNLWCKREFKNLKIANKAGVNCPKPIISRENILIMSFIGVGKYGTPALRLIDLILEDPLPVYSQIIRDLKKLVRAGLVHGDLSAYNILLHYKPYFIDFSHGTTIDNEMALELLERDVKNINSYFSKLNLHLKQPEEVYEELEKIIEKKVKK
jgi:RIO kinase 1